MILIDEDDNFNSEFESYMERMVPQLPGVLRSVSIIGLQSSGKSTVLNEMFSTSFEVLKRGLGTQQTTKGINVSVIGDLVIQDVEGTDSQERHRAASSTQEESNEEIKEEHKDLAASTENKLALFALMTTEALIINVQAEAIGRQTSLCLNLLKRIFEVSLKYPQELVRKQVIFFLRDFNSEDFTEEILCDQVRAKIKLVWESIKKPQRYKRSSLSEFCDLEFITFPHRRYCGAEFTAKAQAVAKRFTDSSNPRYIFKLNPDHICKPSAIPAYYSQLWERIKNDESLDVIVGMLVSQFKEATAAINSKSQELLVLKEIMQDMRDQMSMKEEQLEKSRKLVEEQQHKFYQAELKFCQERIESEKAAAIREREHAKSLHDQRILHLEAKQKESEAHYTALQAERAKIQTEKEEKLKAQSDLAIQEARQKLLDEDKVRIANELAVKEKEAKSLQSDLSYEKNRTRCLVF